MTRLRALVFRHHRLAVLLVGMTLLMKALIPAGIMLDTGPHLLSVKVCADSFGQAITGKIVLHASGATHHGDDGKADSPCHFTVLGHATLGTADPALLTLALLFIIASGFLPLVAVQCARVAHILPPQCGPPSLA